MRVLVVLAAWGVLGVLATLCFALGASVGYRRGVTETIARVRARRAGNAGCQPLSQLHPPHRSSSRLARPGARLRRARWHTGRPAPATAATSTPRAVVDRRVALAAACVAAVVVVGVPVTAVGATTAQPGDRLWAVKLGFEQVRLAMATNPRDDARVHLAVASNRLAELDGMVGADVAPDVVAHVSAHLESHVSAAVERLDEIDDAVHRAELEVRLDDVVDDQFATVQTIVEAECGTDGGRCDVLEQTLDRSVALRRRAAGAGAVVAAEVTEPAVASDDLTPRGVEAAEAATAAATAEAGTEDVAVQDETAVDGAESDPTDAPAAAPADAAADGGGSEAGGSEAAAASEDTSGEEPPAAAAATAAPSVPPSAAAAPAEEAEPAAGSEPAQESDDETTGSAGSDGGAPASGGGDDSVQVDGGPAESASARASAPGHSERSETPVDAAPGTES